MSPAANDNKPNAKGLFCSTCGSADVTASTLAGGDAACNVCGWKGATSELAAFHFTHDMGTDEDVLRAFFLDVRKLLASSFAMAVGQLLIKWGFLDTPTPANMETSKKHLARYLAGAAKGILESVVKTRADIERERHRDPAS